MNVTLPSSVSSQQDLSALRQEIREYAKWFSHNEIKKRVGAHHPTEQPIITAAASDMIREWTTKHPMTTKSLDELLDTLQKIEKSASNVTITLAAPAMGEVRRDLVAWCRQNIEPDILVNFQFNSTLLGGMVVRYGSHIYDWSFRRQIMDNRMKFPEVLRNV